MISFAKLFKSTSSATALALALALPVQAFDLNAMSDEERKVFGEQVRSYLLENPQVILEAIDIIEERNAQAEVQRDKALVQHYLTELTEDGYSFVGGNPDGDITIVEFMDYRCSFCRRAAPEVAALLAADSNIRLVIKEFPILGESSLVASRFAVATKLVEGMEAYKAVHDALIDLPGEPSNVVLSRLAESFGYDAEKILATMNDERVTSELRQNRRLAQNMSIQGTPTFVLGNELVRGYLPADQMKAVIDQQRAERG